MSNWGYEDSDTSQATNSESNGPKALRDAYDALKQQNKDLQDGLATIRQDLTRQKVQSALGTLGVSPEAASHYTGEPDADKISDWVTSMRSVFGAGEISHAPNTTDTPAVTLKGDAAAQLQRMNESGQTGSPLGNADAAMGRVGDASNMQELIDAWKTMC